MRLDNKVALITGGTGGMGSASARLFAKEGAAVVIGARHEEPGITLVKEITDAGGRALFVQMDTTSQDAWDNAVRVAKETYSGLHILMNVVGSNDLSMLPDVDIEQWNKIFEVNVTGTLRGIQTCAPLIKNSGGGSIVNIGSVAGITGNFSTAYSSSKWALEGLSRSAAYVYADWGIRCNTIQPGFIETNMTKGMTANPLARKTFEKTLGNTILLRRAGKSEEIATTALFLASDDSSYITGTDIVVDGGWFSAAPYLGNERSHHMLDLLKKKEQAQGFLKHFH
ncbi:SDR family NAD(P)-dependent oxidoreductase [Arthrobacter sp. ok362]|uniref:SDR family NAD(P)-dependent oxidoreductase n=1 Tax=Arthrobacter sp. ok362 TaxID=1761745 RepID=UPI00088315B0|nr:SDR family NAD(P)-dependent oxidoreductase [Arthrobacter sp. ok362]SDK59883.1 Enoyl-(Acyl carrier protein) reductase [Arthrobacter sp. ok362]